MKDKILKVHKNLKPWFEFSENNGNAIMLEHMTEIGENEVILTAALTININSKSGKKLLSEMIDKQSSPIKKVLQDFDRNRNKDLKEGRGYEYYSLPEEIFNILKED